MSTTPVNIELLDATLDLIHRHVDVWDQTQWAQTLPGDGTVLDNVPELFDAFPKVDRIVGQCKAAFCFAGWAATLDGWKPDAEFVEEATEGAMWRTTTFCVKGEERGSYEGVAQRILGLTSGQATALFNGENDLHGVDEVVRLIKEGETFPYEEYDPDDTYDPDSD